MYKREYKKRYNGQRYYGYLVSKKKGFADITLRNDMYLIDHEKLQQMSFNRSERQMKNYNKMKDDSSTMFTIERKLNRVVEEKKPAEKGKKGKGGGKAKKVKKSTTVATKAKGDAKVEDEGWVVQLHNHSTEIIMVDRDAVSPNETHELSSFQRIAIANEDNLLCLFVDSKPTIDEANPAFVNEGYRLKECIGYGYTGNVFYSFSMQRMQACALKRVNKEKFAEYDGLDCLDELQMLKELNHPNIIELYNFHDTPKFLYLELEYASGGNLFDRLYDEDYGKALTESQAKCIMYQMLSAVVYMHRYDVTHRDIKPENMLLMSRDDFPLTKLADFGTSHIGGGSDEAANVMTSTACTVEHAAPEMLKLKNQEEDVDITEGYTNLVDCWSIGVVTYEALTARQPFYEDSEDDVRIDDKIYAGNFQFFAEDFASIEDPEIPQNLIRSLLRPEVDERLTAQQAFEHPWFTPDIKQQYVQLTSQWRKGYRPLAEHNL